jgi:hypothetical protein
MAELEGPDRPFDLEAHAAAQAAAGSHLAPHLKG